MKKVGILIILLLTIAFVGYFLTSKSSTTPSDHINEAPPPSQSESDSVITTIFTNHETGESLTVAFDNSIEPARVVLTGLGYEALELTQVISASGARYINETDEIELWTNGDEATITTGNDTIFSGSKASGGSSDSNLTNSTWVWRQTQLNSDEVVVPSSPDSFTISFSPDGTVSGTTDCNNFRGNYTTQDNDITFDQLASTMMYCEGSQEAEFTGMVSDSTSYMFDNSGNLVLLLALDSGSVLFERQ